MEFISAACEPRIGVRARIDGLRSRADLNGCLCDVLHASEHDRWACRIDGVTEPISVKPINLTVVAAWPDSDVVELPVTLPKDVDERHKSLCSALAPLGLAELTALELSAQNRAAALTPLHVEAICLVCARLEWLDVGECRHAVSDVSLGLIATLPRLRALSLPGCDAVSDAGLQLLAAGPPVESEEVRSGKRTRGLFAALAYGMGGGVAGLRQLESLDLSRCVRVTDGGLLWVSDGCPRLHTLRLAGCPAVGDRGVCALARNAALACIVLDGCAGVSDAGVATLARQCPLLELGLACGLRELTPFSLRSLVEARGGTTLTALDVGGNPGLDAPACVQALSGRCPRLRRVTLRGCANTVNVGSLDELRREALPRLESVLC
jgi:F-box/leucine-rich repeat protein 2/20